jgi:hypothetical protein
MWHELTWPVFLGGLIGLAFLGRRRATFLYSTLIIYFIFCWLYRFGNWFQVIIPAYPIFIIGCAAGVSGVRCQVSRNTHQSQRPPSGAPRTTHYVLRFTLYVLFTFLILLLLYRFTTNLPRANQHNLPGDTGLDPGWAILADRPQSPALISADFVERVAVQYLQTVWGRGEGLRLTNGPGDFTSHLRVGQVSNLSYYITRQAAAAMPEALGNLKNLPFSDIHPQAAGEQLVWLAEHPLTQLPATAQPLDLPFGDSLQLAGWEPILNSDTLPSRLERANWQVAMYWRAKELLAEDYTISVRPLVGGQVIMVNGAALIQDHQPVWGLHPTSRWRPGEFVRDVYALRLPEGITPETVQIVAYKTTAGGFENIGEQIVSVK